MNKFRITYQKLNITGDYENVFTTIVLCKSMLGAKRKAKNLEPFEWDRRHILDLTNYWNLKLDKIEFNY